MRRARTSLPTPGSPRIRKGAPGSVRCPRATRSRIRAVFRTAGTHWVVASSADICLLPRVPPVGVRGCQPAGPALCPRTPNSTIGVKRRRSITCRQYIFFHRQPPPARIKSQPAGAGDRSRLCLYGAREVPIVWLRKTLAIPSPFTRAPRRMMQFSDCGQWWKCGQLTPPASGASRLSRRTMPTS